MIKYIKIKNGIMHKDRTFNFGRGITVIHGRNGLGKSLIQEFIRFALFGSKALRGNVSDYPKDFSVELSFSIGGKEYKIERSISDCKFNGVVGTTACNKAIVELLGYDLSIFDMGNCAKQKEIDKLGKMTPAERKSAVDRLIGLDVIDELIKEIKEELSDVRGRLSAFSEIKEPEKPELRQIPVKLTKEELQEEKRKIQEVELLNRLLETSKCEKPEPFTQDEPLPPKGTYQGALDKFRYEKTLFETPDVRYMRRELEIEIERQEAWKSWKETEEPKESKEWVAKELEAWDKYGLWIAAKRTTCPKCGTVFAVNGIEEVVKPTSNPDYVVLQKDLWANWKKRPTCPKPQGIEDPRKLILRIEERERLVEKLTLLREERTVEEWESYKKECVEWLKAKESNESQWKKWNEYERVLTDREKIKLGGFKLEDVETSILNLTYNESLIKNYESNLNKYKEIQEKKSDCENLKLKYELAIDGLKNIKLRVKSSITPSLSRVATNLAQEMSDGAISEIKISDSFEILVNGRSLNTFSGSEEAVANLSLRLALGRILTNKVLNIFIGDEIDAAMDDERALLVSKSLLKLKSQLDQIILISHKKVEADEYIELT